MRKIRILWAVMALSGAVLGWGADPLTESVQKGLFEEEANHNLEAAIQAYRTAIARGDEQRRLTATAVFRLGECYRKQRKTNEAAAEYRRVLRDFSDQEELVQPSRQLLASLGIANAAGTPGGDASNLAAEEAEEIQKIQAMIRNSPDLLNLAESGGLSPLQKAAFQGRLEVAKFLLAHGAEVNRRWGNPPSGALTTAVYQGHRAMVELLLANHAQVDLPDGGGDTPLHTAASRGFPAVVQLLLERQAKVDATNNQGLTPLHLAASFGHTAIVHLLAAHGASVNARDSSGRTPLYGAAEHGYLDVARALIEAKADVNLEGIRPAHSPLSVAVLSGQAALVELLAAHGADLKREHALTLREPDRNAAIRPPTSGAVPPLAQAPPLHAAAGRGVPAVVQALLNAHADVHQKDALGAQPLLHAVAQDQLAAAELLLKAGAEVDTPGDWSGRIQSGRRSTPGASPQQVEILRQMNEQLPTGEQRSYAGYTPLLLAVERRSPEMVALLLRYKADPNRAGQGRFPLFAAVVNGDLESVQLLLDHGADPNRLDSNSGSPLSFAQQQLPKGKTDEPSGWKRMVEALRAHGASTEPQRRSMLAVSRQTASYGKPIFVRDTNQLNRLTLCEALAIVYSPVPTLPGFSSNTSGDSFGALAFPDFRRLVLKRMPTQKGAAGEEVLNALPLFESAEAPDPWVEWGDCIDLPELDHSLTTAFMGFSEGAVRLLRQRLKRTVTVILKGQTNQVRLFYSYNIPPWLSFDTGAPTPMAEAPVLLGSVTHKTPYPPTAPPPPRRNPAQGSAPPVEAALVAHWAVPPDDVYKPCNLPLSMTLGPTGRTEHWTNGAGELASFWLSAVVNHSGLLRASSDPSRVKVTRVDPQTRQPQSWVYNIESLANSWNDLWLRDGDVIEIPEKP